MKNLLLILFIAISFNSVAQVEAYIKDDDGYTNVREAKSSNAEIITTIQNAELFNCKPDRESNWWEIEKSDGTTGYVHNSRIIPVSSQTVVIKRFFDEIENANPNNVEFGEVSNEQLFIYAERFPKSFLFAFDQTSPELRKLLIKELESPIHDLIDLKLIYSRISAINEHEATRSEILEAIETAGKSLGIDVSGK
ncbi:MAG: hypothetical protein CMP48_14075 [Rickettsiales bacterium]|nr:hypothetical protein [Rickettsiales bacterium]